MSAAKSEGSRDKTYRGYVHHIEQEVVSLSFHERYSWHTMIVVKFFSCELVTLSVAGISVRQLSKCGIWMIAELGM